MKNVLFLALFALVLCLSCSKKDDEAETNTDGCESCSALGQKLEICPGKSGGVEKTYVITGGDEEQTVTQTQLDDLGVTPKQYVENLCENANNQ